MPTDFSKVEERARKFNEDYGLDFSYQEFEYTVQRHKNLEDGLSIGNGGVSVENQFYLSRFGQMHRKAMNNYIDGKISSFNNEQMLKDYIRLMNGYSATYREQHPEVKLQPWYNGLKLINKINDENMVPGQSSRTTYAKERYLEGKLPLREMRAYCEQLGRQEGGPTKDQLAAIASYAEAIKEVKEEHPWYYKFIHPVRNNAEQRDLKTLKDFVKARCGGTEEAYEDFVIDNIPGNEPRLGAMQNELQMLKIVETSKMQNEKIASERKERISVVDTEKTQKVEISDKVNENPELTKSDLTKGSK